MTDEKTKRKTFVKKKTRKNILLVLCYQIVGLMSLLVILMKNTFIIIIE